MVQDLKQFLVENAAQVKKTILEGTAGGSVAALTLNEWVAIATLGYLALQSAYLIWKWKKEAKKKK